jgi:hypothetical protein
MTYYKAPHVFSDTENSLAVNIARQLGSAWTHECGGCRASCTRTADLLAREVQHRTKNLFLVVQAIVARSFANKRTVQEQRPPLGNASTPSLKRTPFLSIRNGKALTSPKSFEQKWVLTLIGLASKAQV